MYTPQQVRNTERSPQTQSPLQKTSAKSNSVSPSAILQMQKAMGNQAVSRWLTSQLRAQSKPVQASTPAVIQGAWKKHEENQEYADKTVSNKVEELLENIKTMGGTLYVDEVNQKLYEYIEEGYAIEHIWDGEDWETVDYDVDNDDEFRDKFEDVDGQFLTEDVENTRLFDLFANTRNLVDDDVKKLLRNKDHDVSQLRKLAALVTNNHVLSNVVSLVNEDMKLKEILQIFEFNASHHAYAETDVYQFIIDAQRSTPRTMFALTETVSERNVRYVRLILHYNVVAGNPLAYKLLIHILASIRDGHNTMTVSQNDVNYVGSHNPPSRTGFLVFTFRDGSTADIHTHWNVNDKKIVSMHVQTAPGVNGGEINQLGAFFGDVITAVVHAHNTSAAHPATMTPPQVNLTV